MTDLANSCAIPLFRRPQGSQGCLEKQNFPLSSNLAVWCAKIGPKTQKLQKTIKKPSFLTFVWSILRFFELGFNFSVPKLQIQT